MSHVSKVWTAIACTRAQCNQRNPHLQTFMAFWVEDLREQLFPLVTSNTHTHTQNVTRFPGPSAVDKPHNEDFLSESSHLPTRSKDRTVKKGTWPCFSLCSYIRFSGHMHFLSRDFSPRSQEGDCWMQNSGFLPPEQLILTFFKMSSRLTSCKKHLKACCTITLKCPPLCSLQSAGFYNSIYYRGQKRDWLTGLFSSPKLGAVESQNTVSYPMPSAGLHRLYITSLPVLSWGAGGGV